MKLAQAARDAGNENQMLLSSRKAARLKESNEKYTVLLQKMEILYRILTKMHDNSEVLLEDTRDQVKLKEQERKAIRTSHSAMKSAMSIISGDPDKRAMFDMAMETIADDVANKVGEMERFMEMSSNFMDSVDLQNGVFEEQGLKMLEEWEKKSSLMLLDGSSSSLSSPSSLDLNQKGFSKMKHQKFLVPLRMIISLTANFMKNNVLTSIILTILSILNLSGQDNKKAMDWANLARYKEANIALLKEKPSTNTVVLMGNSITEGWVRERPDF